MIVDRFTYHHLLPAGRPVGNHKVELYTGGSDEQYFGNYYPKNLSL